MSVVSKPELPPNQVTRTSITGSRKHKASLSLDTPVDPAADSSEDPGDIGCMQNRQEKRIRVDGTHTPSDEQDGESGSTAGVNLGTVSDCSL